MTDTTTPLHKSAKIYIAGHRGLVGSAIYNQLKENGHKNLIVRTHAELDLTDQEATAQFFSKEKPDYVFLAAAKVGGIIANNTYPADFIRMNLLIQTHVIHQSYAAGVKRLLFLGSSCIYPKFCPQPMKEEHLLTGPLEPTNSPYAVAKISGIEMCRSYNRQYDTDFLSVMPTNLYGPADNFDLMNSHVLPALIRKFHLAKLAMQGDNASIVNDIEHFGPLPDDIQTAIGLDEEGKLQNNHAPYVLLWGTGGAKREFLYVDDMASACIYLMQNDTPHDLINIGYGSDIKIREAADLVNSIVGFQGEVRYDNTKPDGTPQKLLDTSRLKETGWQPTTSLEDGIRKSYQWYLEQLRD